MRRLFMLMIVAAVAGGQSQDLGLVFTNGESNGLPWLRMNTAQKTLVVLGAEGGFKEAQDEFAMAKAGVKDPICKRSLVDTYQLPAGTTNKDVIRVIDAFYNVGANISLPWSYAFLYSDMKLAGATQDELDTIRKAFQDAVK